MRAKKTKAELFMDVRENTLRAIRFERPEHIPVIFHINAACWHHYPEDALAGLMADHPTLFPDFSPEYISGRREPSPWERADVPYTDPWGCVWETSDDGICGSVTHHPLADWDALETYTPPDPAQVWGMGPEDWSRVAADMQKARAAGELCHGSLEHGHMFLRLIYLRGYENIIFDMSDADPRIERLIEMVEDFSMGIVGRYMDLGVDMMSYPEDLGMQAGPMLSPEHLRKYIMPSYERLMAPAREAGCLVHMHSDGDIRDLVDDLVTSGVDVVNLQDLVNGIGWIEANLKGRVCIDLDIDRQQITRFGAPAQIEALIRKEVETLGSREGGLMMIFGLYPGTPLENVKALMDAMARYSTYYV